MNQKERMLAGLPYKAWLDGLPEERLHARELVYRFNHLRPSEREEMDRTLRELLGKAGDNLFIEAPFHCDYGGNITVGDNFYANFNCVMLDVGPITVGDNVFFAPNVAVYTAGHPIHPDPRNEGWEYGIGVTVGDHVWVGGNTVINPGVTIGSHVVIGSGSVVTKDIPDWCVAAGNPCRVLRAITEEDRAYYFKNRRFDEAAE